MVINGTDGETDFLKIPMRDMKKYAITHNRMPLVGFFSMNVWSVFVFMGFCVANYGAKPQACIVHASVPEWILKSLGA